MALVRKRRTYVDIDEALELSDVRDGFTRKERIVLFSIARLEEELGGRNVPLPMLYGRVLEHVDLGVPELVAIVVRLGANGRRAPSEQ